MSENDINLFKNNLNKIRSFELEGMDIINKEIKNQAQKNMNEFDPGMKEIE